MRLVSPEGTQLGGVRDARVQTATRSLRTTAPWWGAVRVIAPLGAFSVEGWPALIGALLVQEGGLWLAGRLSGGGHRQFTRGLFLAAYGLRMAIALPTHAIARIGDGNGALFRDDYTNDLVAEWLTRIARGDGSVAIFPGHQYLLSSIYSYFLMGIYSVSGYSPLEPKLLNVSLAALCAVLVFAIARKMFPAPAAILAAAGAAVLPSFVVWSVATLKETLVLFAALLALWTIQFLTTANTRDRRVADALVLLFGLVVLLLDLRSSTAFIMLALLGVVAAARSHVTLRAWQLALASCLAIGLLAGGLIVLRMRSSDRPLSGTLEDFALQVRHRRAQEAAGAGSQLRAQIEVVSPTGSDLPAAELASDTEPFSVVGDVLDPLGYALLAPAPWQAQSSMELGASAEMPIWYVLIVASIFAWRATQQHQRLFVGSLIVYAVANWLLLAAVEGNLGNLLRHRLMLDPVLLILGSAGLYWLYRARRMRLSR